MIQNKKETQLHFVGIGGIGMSGIAEVFLNQGYQVSGSDIADSDITRRLRSLGAKIAIGHAAENVQGASVVVISSAIRPANPEILEARRLRVPIIPRAEMLAELMRGKTGIAVAGTHGKTTTTSLLSTVLTVAGLDPTLVIGGKVDSLGGNAKLGQGNFVVAEADESDGSFLYLPATFGVVTNIDNDHLDHFGSLAAIEDAFVQFVGKLPFYGLAAVCGEDQGVRRCLSRWTKPVVTYGLSEEWDLYASNIRRNDLGSQFTVHAREGGSGNQKHETLGDIELMVPGRHNVLNTLATIAIGRKLGIPFQTLAEGLKSFRGVKRRFEIRWRNSEHKQMIVDDYGHHPTEIATTLATARAYWPGRIITVFQPHRYTRTIHCLDGFLSAFQNADVLLVTDIYAAGEDPVEGVNAEALVRAIRKAAPSTQEIHYVGELAQAKNTILEHFSPGDLVICLGAGSITRLPEQLVSALKV